MSAERELHVIADGLSFLEGPRWHAGRLYVSDFFTKQILSFAEDGSRERVATVPGQPSGLGFAPDDVLHVVSMLDRRLMRVVGGDLVEVADLSGETSRPCNDMTIDTQGRAYIGNYGFDLDSNDGVRPTRLLRVDPDGTVSVAATDLVFPNGTVITPDGKTLLIAETFAARITAFDVGADGTLSGRRTWASFADGPFEFASDAVASGALLPDGMALDAEGAVWVANAAGRGALRVAEGGKILDEVVLGDLTAFAVALGGADRSTLYLCASPPLFTSDPPVDHRARLVACSVDVPGAGVP